MAVRQKLTPGEKYLYAILKDPSGMDQAEFLFHTGDEEMNHCWRAWPFQWKWFTDLSPLQVEQSSRCLKEGSLVLTDEGWLPIQEVRVGQQVLTHRNRWRKVTEVYDNGVKPVVAVRGQGPADPLVMTEDHQFWGAHAIRASGPKDGHKGKKLVPGWMTPAEFKVNDGSGQMSSNWASPAKVEPLPLPPQLVPAYRSGRQNIVKDIFTVPFMWMLGLYLAEGSTWISDKNCTVRWSIHVSELQHVTDVLNQTGLRWNISKLNTSNKCVNVCVNSRPVAVFLREHCGHGAENKKVPTWAYGLSNPLKEAILDGVHFGDSHRRPSGRDETSTVSYPLALGVKILAQTLNRSASVIVVRPAGQTTIRGRTYESRKAYSTSTYSLELQKRAHVQIQDGHAWSPINEVSPAGVARTWDLEVEEDHSFVADGVVVHNSVGKTTSILVRLFSFVFLYPNQEAVITAPELVHLNPIIGLIEESILSCRLTKDMLQKRGAGNGITHRPFAMLFKNGAHIFGRIPQKSGAGIKGCIGAGALVLTKRGLVPVEEVVVGDDVWSHLKRWSPVLGVQEFEDDTFLMKGQGTFETVVSQGHQVFVRHDVSRHPGKTKIQYGPLRWERVENWGDRPWYWTSCVDFSGIDLPVEPPDFAGYNANTKQFRTDTVAFWWIVGRYLADGYTTIGKNGERGRTHIVVHPRDQSEVLTAVELVGLSASIKERDHSSADLLEISSTPLAAWLKEIFGSNAYTKTVPPFVLGLSEEMRHAFLEGYWSGDGNWDPMRLRHFSGSASKALTVGMAMVAQSLGEVISMTRFDVKVDQIMGVELKKKAAPAWRMTATDPEKGRGYFADGYVSYRLKNVAPNGRAMVYNIISEDHSYLADNMFHHNTHPIVLEMDEAQDYGEPGWIEIMETLKMGFKGASWRVHGVTRGVRDTFFSLTQPGSGWKVHRYQAMCRPNWTDEERQAKIRLYGSRDSPDYKRNIEGLHGDESSPFLVLRRIMAIVDRDEYSEYNKEYQFIKIDDGLMNEHGNNADLLLRLPQSHLSSDRLGFYAGMDVGFTIAPSEIVILAAERPDPTQPIVYRLLTRVQMKRMDHRQQVEVIMKLIDFYDLKMFAMDKSGNGLSLFTDMQARSLDHARIIKGYNFSEKILVNIDETVDVDEHRDDIVEKAGQKKNVLEAASDAVRLLVDTQRLRLPWDKDLLGEMQGQHYIVMKDHRNIYGRKVYSEGKYHVLDALRMFCLGVTQTPFEEIIDRHENPRKYREPVLDVFL